MTPPLRPYSPDNPFAPSGRRYSPDNPFAPRGDEEAERERHARLAAVGLQREPTDSGIGSPLGDGPVSPGGYGNLQRLGRALTDPKLYLKATSALNPFQDEIAGVIEGVGRAIVPGGKGFREGYTEARDAARAPVHQFEEENPKTALAMDLVGGAVSPLNRVVPGAGLGNAARVTRAGRALQAARAGAAGGAAFTFGAAEGDVGSQIAQTAIGAGLGGVLGGGIGYALDPRAATRGGRVADEALQQIRKEGDNPAQVIARADPSKSVRENLGRPGQAMALDLALAGGEGGRLVRDAAADRLARVEAAGDRLKQTYASGVADVRARATAALDESLVATGRATDEVAERTSAGLREAKSAATAARLSAEEAAAGDRVADAFARHAGEPRHTLLQYESTAKRALQRVGRQVFGPLDRQLVSASPDTQVGMALQNPLVRETVAKFADPRGAKGFSGVGALRKAYTDLGDRAWAASKNGGALADGTSMTALREARDLLAEALERQVDGFRAANARYRAQASTLEAFGDGYAGARNAKAPDIADHLRELRRIDPRAEKAYLTGHRLGIVDHLRELPTDQAAPGGLFAPGSHAMDRLRLAFPSERAFRSFMGDLERMQRDMAIPGAALDEVRTMARGRVRDATRAIRERGIAERSGIRSRALDDVRRLRGERDAARGGLPDTKADKQILSAARARPATTEPSRIMKFLTSIGLGLLRSAGKDVSSDAAVAAQRHSPEVRRLMAEWLESGGGLDLLTQFQADAAGVRRIGQRAGAAAGSAVGGAFR